MKKLDRDSSDQLVNADIIYLFDKQIRYGIRFVKNIGQDSFYHQIDFNIIDLIDEQNRYNIGVIKKIRLNFFRINQSISMLLV